MIRTRLLPLLLLISWITPLAASAQLWSGIIAPSRATDWTSAGMTVPSGSWTQCGSTIAPYGSSTAPGSSAAINIALLECPANQFVLLGSGDFWLNSGIQPNQTWPYNTAVPTGFVIVASGGIWEATTGGTTGTAFVPFTSSPQTDNTVIWTKVGTPIAQSTGVAYGSNVVLRGAGANLTRLHFSAGTGCNGWGANVCLNGSNTYGGGGYTQANWTGGYTQGTSTITLDNVTGIITNLTPIVLDQCDTGFTGTAGSETCAGDPVDNNNIYVCQTEAVCSVGPSANTARPNRGQEEVVIATAISGTGPYTVTISPALRNPNWAADQTAEAWWGTQTITNSGIEDLLIDTTADATSSVVLDAGYKLWVEGIASNYSNNYHVKNYLVSHSVVRDSYFYWTTNAGTQSYGIGGGTDGDILLENNIIQGVTDPLNFDAPCSGCVASYNFAVNQYNWTLAYMFGAGSMHAAGQSMILFEGNIGDYVDADDVHGSHTMDTQFRNYWNGYESNNGTLPTANTSPIHLAAYSRYMNLIGNVLGTAGYHTIYQCVPAATTTTVCANEFKDIFDLGWSGNTQGHIDVSSPASPNDLLTAPTLLRWANWDVVTNATHFCGGTADTGWTTTCASSSEIPTTDPYYPNPIPTIGDTGAGMAGLPASFHYASKPSWWTATTAWPPIGPDVTGGNIQQCANGQYQWSLALASSQCAGGTSLASTVGGHAVAIPAMSCYLNTMGGTPDGTGSMLTFSAASCYGGSTSSTPPTPTNISATVQAQ